MPGASCKSPWPSGLRAKDEAPPYPAAVAAGVKLIMASWAIYPALDATHPAGLSSAVVQGELRGRLGYQGVTITDALGGRARWPRSAATGSGPCWPPRPGWTCCCARRRTPAEGQAVASALASALDSGRLGSAAFDAAVQRVTALRAGLH